MGGNSVALCFCLCVWVVYLCSYFWASTTSMRRSKASMCLLHTDPRSRYMIRLPPKLPGMHYSADEQCQILFGTNATFCNDMEVPQDLSFAFLQHDPSHKLNRKGGGVVEFKLTTRA